MYDNLAVPMLIGAALALVMISVLLNSRPLFKPLKWSEITFEILSNPELYYKRQTVTTDEIRATSLRLAMFAFLICFISGICSASGMSSQWCGVARVANELSMMSKSSAGFGIATLLIAAEW
jgi:hypothetical protein